MPASTARPSVTAGGVGGRPAGNSFASGAAGTALTARTAGAARTAEAASATGAAVANQQPACTPVTT
nr:hypothetical protein [Mycobacterium tuberculosis]